jgi:hypothetical protein
VDSPKDPASNPSSNGSGSKPAEAETSQFSAATPGPDAVVWPDDPYSSEGSASEPEGNEGSPPQVTSPVVPAWPEAFGEPAIPAKTPLDTEGDNDDTAQFATSPGVPTWPEKAATPPSVSKTTPPQPRAPDTAKTVPPQPRTPTAPPPVDAEAADVSEAVAEPEGSPEPKHEPKPAPRREPKAEPRPKLGFRTIGGPTDDDEPKPTGARTLGDTTDEAEAEARVEEPPPDPEKVARDAAEGAAAATAFEESAIAAEAAARAAAEAKVREEAEAAARAEAEAKAKAEAEARAKEEAEARAREEAEAAAVAAAEAKKKADEEAAAAAAEQEALRQRLKNRDFPVQDSKPGDWPANPPIPSWAPQPPGAPPAPAAQAAESGTAVPPWAPQSTTHGWSSQQSSIRSSPSWGTRSGSTSTPPAGTPASPRASELPKPASAPVPPAPVPPAAAQPPPPPAPPAAPSARPVAPAQQPQGRPAWEIVRQEGEDVEPVYQGPSAEDRSYSEWFAWAKRSGAPAQACHAAAQGAFRALAAGQDMNTAVQWATLAMASPPGLVGANRQLYCAWFSLGNIDLKLPTQQAHAFATGAIKALDSGADSMVAHQAGLHAAGITT